MNEMGGGDLEVGGVSNTSEITNYDNDRNWKERRSVLKGSKMKPIFEQRDLVS